MAKNLIQEGKFDEALVVLLKAEKHFKDLKETNDAQDKDPLTSFGVIFNTACVCACYKKIMANTVEAEDYDRKCIEYLKEANTIGKFMTQELLNMW